MNQLTVSQNVVSAYRSWKDFYNFAFNIVINFHFSLFAFALNLFLEPLKDISPKLFPWATYKLLAPWHWASIV